MTSKKRTYRQEKLAKIYDSEVLPVWSQRFGRMLLRDLDLPEKCQVLDVACGTGYPGLDLVRRLGAGSRLIAIDSSSAMLDVARKKVEEGGVKGVFFRTESAVPRLSFAGDVYDLVLCNLGLGEMPSPARALADFARVTKPGGQVRCTIPLEGTFEEFYDIYREVLTKHDKHDTLTRLAEYVALAHPSPAQVESWMKSARLEDPRIEVERFTMLFRSSREFFFAPVIEYGPLAAWKEIAGSGQEMQDVFWYIKEAIDAYFEGRAFAVTVVAGCLIGRKVESAAAAALDVVSRPVTDGRAATGSAVIELGTHEIELSDIPEMADEDDPSAAGGDDDDDEEDTGVGGDSAADTSEDVELDAFVEGKKRPDHLRGGSGGE